MMLTVKLIDCEVIVIINIQKLFIIIFFNIDAKEKEKSLNSKRKMKFVIYKKLRNQLWYAI
jgi:hypothetical protein